MNRCPLMKECFIMFSDEKFVFMFGFLNNNNQAPEKINYKSECLINRFLNKIKSQT